MRKIFIHIGILVILSIFIFWGTLKYLDSYTNHDAELIEISDLKGLNISVALANLRQNGLEGIVTDTVYKDGVEKLAVINQNPVAGMRVKQGRKVYLVVNLDAIPMVKVPDLANKSSLNQARNVLIRSHLRLGKVIKKVSTSVRTDTDQPILAQYFSGTQNPIEPGTMIERNSTIDLVVGVYSLEESDSMLTDESTIIKGDNF